jgi:hypothetical protein
MEAGSQRSAGRVDSDDCEGINADQCQWRVHLREDGGRRRQGHGL